MRRLRFRYQRLLELKERVEESRKRVLGEAVGALAQEEQQLAQLRHTRALYRRAAESPGARALDMGLLLLNSSYDQRLQRQIQDQRRRVQQAEALVEERRQRLVEASRERRVYEILKERVTETYRRARRRQEQRWLDEVGERLHQRRAKDTEA